MKKIPTLFLRDFANPAVMTNVENSDAQWVVKGEGIATVKYDGTATMVRNGQLFKRFDRKPGKGKKEFKPEPAGWIVCDEEPDRDGHWPGWIPVDFGGPEDKWHKEAWERRLGPDRTTNLADGTYELVGPKVQGNPYKLEEHQLWPHGVTFQQYSPDFDIEPPRDHDGLREWFEAWENVEGIVWHHPDGRMAKIKRRDFGLPWPPKK